MWKISGNGGEGERMSAGGQFPQSSHKGLRDCECQGLNCVLLKDVEVLTPSACECDLIWNQSGSLQMIKLRRGH